MKVAIELLLVPRPDIPVELESVYIAKLRQLLIGCVAAADQERSSMSSEILNAHEWRSKYMELRKIEAQACADLANSIAGIVGSMIGEKNFRVDK